MDKNETTLPAEDYKTRRKRLDRERYLREREMRLERQRAYYKTHREEILRKKREKAVYLPVIEDKRAKRAEIYHNWYLRNREAQIEKMRKLRLLKKESLCTKSKIS